MRGKQEISAAVSITLLDYLPIQADCVTIKL